MTGYLRPVPFTGLSTWRAHTERDTPSTEPGVDYYCPIGTPVLAAGAGIVVEVSDGIIFAGGRFVTINLDDGRRARYLHLSRRVVKPGDRVWRGMLLGYSGATGYGKEDWSKDPSTGGAHVHMTLWRTQREVFGRYATIDPEPFMDETPGKASPTGGGNNTTTKDDLDMHAGQTINVLPDDYNFPTGGKVPEANGTIMIAVVGGDWAAFPPDANGVYPENVRGIIEATDYDRRPIPTLSQKDFAAKRTQWRVANGK